MRDRMHCKCKEDWNDKKKKEFILIYDARKKYL